MLVTILKTLSGTLVPLVMVAVGFQLTLRLSRSSTVPLCSGLFIKLIAAPVCALLLCKLAGLEGEAVVDESLSGLLVSWKRTLSSEV